MLLWYDELGAQFLPGVMQYTATTTADRGMPLFYQAEREFVLHKLMGRELVENLIKQRVDLYRIDHTTTESNFYGESKAKNYQSVVTLTARVQIADEDVLLEGGIRKLKRGDMTMHVYDDLLTELGVEEIKVGDFLKFEGKFYEIFDNGPNDDENQRRLGVDYEFFKTYLAHVVESDVFSGR